MRTLLPEDRLRTRAPFLEEGGGARTFIEDLPIGVYRTSPDGRVLMANAALLGMLGCSSLEELSARDLNEEFEPEYRRDEFRRNLEREGRVMGLESLWRRKDGSTFYARENAKAVRDGRGATLYYEGTVEDVTERKRAEGESQALHEVVQGVNATDNLEQLFKLIHRSVGAVLYAENCFIALYNSETGLLHFEFFVDKYDPPPPPRPLGKGLTGYVLHNDRPLLLSHEDQRRMAEQGLVEIFGTYAASWLGVPLRTPAGAIGVMVVQHYEEASAYAGRDLEFMVSVGGQVALAIERKRAEAALRRSEAEYRALFDQIADPVFVVDRATQRFLDCNRAFLSAYGYTPEELSGMTPHDLQPAGAGDRRARAERRSAGAATHLTKDGRRILVEISSQEISYRERPAWLGLARDVTERVRAEEEMKLFAARLESSNRELQDFASVASHDLQEPLRKIQAFGDRLKTKCGDALGEEGRDYLSRMQNAAQRMQTLINDLLTFSRVTTKAQPFVAVDLAEVARGVVSDLEARVEQTGGRVEIGEMMTIDADPLQMRQLLQNLIGNALKFHKPGEPPVVRVYCSDGADDGAPTAEGFCRLVVEDNGIGFDEKYLDRIFTVFQRLHGRGAYEGTGVGLAVVRRIAERHGGGVTARSAPGRGSAFIVTLPVSRHEGETI
jgi:PAS domain S-box-containing protein